MEPPILQWNKPVLLVVDDERSVALSLTRIFRKDYHVLTAFSGEEALAFLKKHDISVLLTDYQMPGMSGIELIREVSRINPHVFHLIMSGHLEIEQKIQYNDVGSNCSVVAKPWDNEELIEKVAMAFSASHALRAERRLTSLL